jgi:hypothetical protein
MGLTILPLVEGHSEVRAIRDLLLRLLQRAGIQEAVVVRPFRVHRSQVVRAEEIERALRHALSARARDGVNAVLVLLDADKDCPAEMAPRLLGRARDASSQPVRVVLPKAEIEAWVLAGIESLRGRRGIRADAECPPDAEAIRNAKGAISELMEGTRGYVATDDLPAFLATLDLDVALHKSPSLAKLDRDLRSLAEEARQLSS